MPVYHTIRDLETLTLTQGILGVDGIYNDNGEYINPSTQPLISNSYIDRRRGLNPALGDYSVGAPQPIYPGGGMIEDDYNYEQQQPTFVQTSPPPPPQPQPMVVDTYSTTKLDTFSFKEPSNVNDITKILFVIMLFVISSLYFHTVVLYRSGDKEWAFFLKVAFVSTLVYIMMLWTLDISIQDLHQ